MGDLTLDPLTLDPSDIVRTPDPKGDRVNVVLSGKFLPYETC